MTLLASARGVPTHAGLVDLDVRAGDVVLLRGPNGSGKTSLLRALAGLPAARAPASARASAPSLSPQDARDALVGLTVGGELRLRRRAGSAGLDALLERESATLSSGEARRVALACAEGAPVLLLDEPAEGLDADGRDRLRALVAAAARRGAVVAADHGALLEPLATRVLVLGEDDATPLPEVPRVEGATVLRAQARKVRGVALPALELGPGLHALRGPNGAGKSTLLLRLAGILDAEGVEIHGARPEPGRNARLALPHARDALLRERVADECPEHPLVPAALRARHPWTLSGGEAQRVALAKALGVAAPVHLLDEPEAHLDADGRAALARAIAQRVAEGACVLMATHDPALLARAHAVVHVGVRA